MKRTFILFALLFFTIVGLIAQTVPAGMKYQAVARDGDGKILSLERIGLEIELLQGGPAGSVVFSEVHQVTTNVLGLFTVTIGQGESRVGTLQEVPWSSSEIWMNIGIDERGGEQFTTITTTKLLTVPYAFHAGTAEAVIPGPDVELQEKFAEPYCAPSDCPCAGGFLEMKVYYFGEDGVDIEVFGNSSLGISITSFTGVNKGDLLTIDGTTTALGHLYSKTYLRVVNGAGEACITRIPSRCATNSFPGAIEDNEVVGKSFGDFIVFSRVDEGYNSDCTVADKGQDWRVGGNILDAADTKLGARNDQNVTFITNDIPRGVFTNDGDLGILNNVDLNTSSGETRNHGDFTVANLKSTLLSGTLTVDLATDLNASLNVDGPSELQSSLTVENSSSTKLTGTLLVEGNSIFNEQVLLDNAALNSNSINSGALVVNGGVGIGKNLNVGGASAFGGPVNFQGAVSITDETQSDNSATGALIVTGGVGVGKNLNTGGTITVEDGTDSAGSGSGSLSVKGGAGIVKKLNVGGVTRLENDLESSSASSGALVVDGGAGIGKRLHVGGDNESTSTNNGALVVDGGAGIGKRLNVGGIVDIDAGSSSGTVLKVKGGVATSSGSNPITNQGQHIANFENTADGNGISIKLGVSTPHNDNNFITFYNSSDATVGRIEGEDSDDNSDDFDRNREYKDDEAFLITDITFATLDIAIAGLESVQASVDVAAAASSSTACAGLGACVTTPIPSLIVASAAALVLKLANAVQLGGNLVKASANLVVFRDTHKALEGITFASGSEDYAEYLPKMNPDEKFIPGDIVGVKNGFISKNTNNADMIMVISLKPVVLGGLPRNGDVSNLEKVAFMGQIPTRVMGKVSTGDYILPSGFNTGVGIAKNPKMMKPRDYKNILGVAWEGKEDPGLGYVNTAIGLNSNDMADVMQQQSEKIEELKGEIAALKGETTKTNEILAQLLPGFAEAANMDKKEYVEYPHEEDEHVSDDDLTLQSHDHNDFVQPGADQIVYFEIDRQYLEEGLKLAEENAIKAFRDAGLDINDHPFWNRVYNDPSYKEELLEQINEELKHSFHTHKEINDRIIDNK